MNIAVVVHRFAPAIGGSERYAEVLAENLHDAGHEVTVYTTRHPDRDPNAYPYEIREFANAIPENFGYFAWPGLFTPDTLRSLRDQDVVHAVAANMFSAVVGALVSRLFDTPAVLTTFYHPARMQTHQRLKQTYDHLVLRPVLRQYDHLLVSSDFELEQLQADFDLSKSDIVRMNVPPTLDATPATDFRANNGIDADAFLLLYVGRLDSHKGIDTLLPAVERLSEDVPSHRCVVVGETERWHEWPTKVARIVDENEARFVFTGTLTGSDLAAVYEASDVFIFPSAYETYGLVTVEALSYGTPVVSTSVGIAPELIEDGANGYLFNEGSIDELVECLCHVERADDEKMHHAAKESVENFRWNETISELIRLHSLEATHT